MKLMQRMSPPLGRWPGDPSVVARGPSARPFADRLAKGLGWFSIGLGLVELIAPARLAKPLGMRGREGLVRAYGAREIASGVAVLGADPRAGMWSRVGGDLLDLGTLGAAAMHARRRTRGNIAIAAAVVGGALVIDAVCAGLLNRRHGRRSIGRDYSDRSGFPRSPEAMRGAARATPPSDLRAPLPGAGAHAQAPQGPVH